jgi:hypothetical protein
MWPVFLPPALSLIGLLSSQILHLERFPEAQFLPIPSQRLTLLGTGRGRFPSRSAGKARRNGTLPFGASPLHGRSPWSLTPPLGPPTPGRARDRRQPKSCSAWFTVYQALS